MVSGGSAPEACAPRVDRHAPTLTRPCWGRELLRPDSARYRALVQGAILRWKKARCVVSGGSAPEACAPRADRHAPTLTRSCWTMHYPQLVSTTCVSAGMIAMGAVVGDWPSDSAPTQPCQHVLDELLYPFVIRVSHGLECSSHAAALAALTIRRLVERCLGWS